MISQCEFLNPGMSHKDRIAKAMLMAAEKRGDLTAPDGKAVEWTWKHERI